MIKIIGIIFLIISGISIGFVFSFRSLNHINFLREYTSLILDIKTEIKYCQKPLFEILKNYSGKRYLFSLIKKCLNLSETCSFEVAWQTAFSNLFNSYGVTPEEENIIKNFASKLGTSDIESQLNYCEYNILLIKPFLQKAIENKTKNQKLPIVLGLSLSLIISIIII